jgi:hypothetical protein
VHRHLPQALADGQGGDGTRRSVDGEEQRDARRKAAHLLDIEGLDPGRLRRPGERCGRRPRILRDHGRCSADARPRGRDRDRDPTHPMPLGHR